MTDNSTLVGLEIANPAVYKEFRQIVASLDGFRVKDSDESLRSDILVIEAENDLQSVFQRIQKIRKSGQAVAICVTSSSKDPDLLIQAMRAGAQEFVTQPITDEEVRNAFQELKQKLQHSSSAQNTSEEKVGKVITVVGSKGGVGTTTVAVNLATGLQNEKTVNSTALVDMNLLFGEIPLFMDIRPSFNWGEVAKNISRLDSTYLMSILSKHSSGVSVLPSPTALNGGEVATPEVIDHLLSVMRTEFDFIVIDIGLSLDALSIRVLELSDTVLIVSTLSLPGLMNVRKILDTCSRIGLPILDKIDVIMNRCDKKSAISIKEAQESLQKPIRWFVPNNYQTTMAAINQGKTLAEIDPGCEVSAKLNEIAESFVGNGLKANKKRRLFSWGGRRN